MESKLMPKKREYAALMIKESKWQDFMKSAHNYGFKDRDAYNGKGELFRKVGERREICIHTEMTDDIEREIWTMIPRFGETCKPDIVRVYIADLIAEGYVQEVSADDHK